MLIFRRLFSFESFKKIQKGIFYLFIIFLPTQFGKHFWLQESLKKGLRIDYFAPTIYFQDLLVITLVIIIISKNKLKIFKIHHVLISLLFCVQFFWSKTPINHIYFSLRILTSILLFNLVKKYFYYDQIKINKIFFYQSVFLFITSTFQVFLEKSLGGIFYYLGERSFFITTPGISLFNILGQNYLRPYSTFSHPNALAGYSLIIFFYTLFFNKNKLQAAITQGLLFLTILLTFSQNSWFFLIFFLFLNYIIRKTKHNNKKLILATFLSMIIPFLMLIVGKKINLSQDFKIRNILFEQAFKNNFKNIIFGGGWFSDIVSLFKSNTRVNNIGIYQPIHHSWWFSIFSIGILPLVALWTHFKIINICNIRKKWLFIFSIIIATGTFDHYWVTQIQNYYLLIFIFIDFQKSNS